MFRYLFRAASAWFLWRWLKTRWRGTAALVAVILLTSLLHDEYVEYVQLTDNDELLIAAYLLKWCINLSALGLYFLYSFRRTVAQPDGKPVGDSVVKRPQATARNEIATTARHDGFDAIRSKPSLASKADKLLDQ